MRFLCKYHIQLATLSKKNAFLKMEKVCQDAFNIFKMLDASKCFPSSTLSFQENMEKDDFIVKTSTCMFADNIHSTLMKKPSYEILRVTKYMKSDEFRLS